MLLCKGKTVNTGCMRPLNWITVGNSHLFLKVMVSVYEHVSIGSRNSFLWKIVFSDQDKVFSLYTFHVCKYVYICTHTNNIQINILYIYVYIFVLAFPMPAASSMFRVNAVEQSKLGTMLLQPGSLICKVCFAFSAMTLQLRASDKHLFCKYSFPFPPRWL